MGGREEKDVAYVCYQTSEDAEAAIVGLNGQTVSFNTSSVLLRSPFSSFICRTTSPSFPCTCLACSCKCWTDHLSGNGKSCLLLSALHSCNLHTRSSPRTHGIKAHTFLWRPVGPDVPRCIVFCSPGPAIHVRSHLMGFWFRSEIQFSSYKWSLLLGNGILSPGGSPPSRYNVLL